MFPNALDFWFVKSVFWLSNLVGRSVYTADISFIGQVMIVIARNFGQLGNRLFLYAHMIAAAKHYNTTVANPCFAEYAHLFCHTQSDLWCRYPVVAKTNSPSLRQRRWLAKSVYLSSRMLAIVGLRSYPLNIIRLKGDEACDLGGDEFAALARDNRHVLAQGWKFRSNELMHKHADAIRSHFQILPEHQTNVDATVAKIRNQADVVVGVHIRHGDYKTFEGGKYFYSVEHYAKRMRQVTDQFSGQRVAFLVCSNAEMTPSDFAGLNVHYGTGHIVEDMYSFAQCDLLIGPPSTYTGWASFYGSVPRCELTSVDTTINAKALLGHQQNEDRHEPRKVA